MPMEKGGEMGESEKMEEAEEIAELLRDRFRLSVITIAEAEAKQHGMEIKESVVACISDLAFKFTDVRNIDLVALAQRMLIEARGCYLEASGRFSLIPSLFQNHFGGVNHCQILWKEEVLANDVRLFAQHAGRKSVNMEDVMLSAHRNEHLLGLLRSFSRDLKGKETKTGKTGKTGKTRKRPSKKEDMIDAS